MPGTNFLSSYAGIVRFRFSGFISQRIPFNITHPGRKLTNRDQIIVPNFFSPAAVRAEAILRQLPEQEAAVSAAGPL